MLRGRFGESTGSPYVEGHLLLPGLRQRSEISFLVDTGAARTTLSPLDSVKMGIEFSKLPGEVHEDISGVGGRARSKTLRALVAFNDPGRTVYVYDISLSILQPHESIERIPSLLGRDILNRWIMRYAYVTRRLTFSVASADFEYPVNPG